MVHRSNTAIPEPKMLLLYIFLVSCCLPGSLGDAVEEFKDNLKKLVDPANKEIFIPVPRGKFQCSDVPCQMKKTIEGLKVYFKNEPATTRISVMEKNMGYITSTLNITQTEPRNTTSCLMRDLPLQTALERFIKYFQKLHEKC